MAFSKHVKFLFGADTKGVQQGLDKAERKVNKFSRAFKDRFIGAIGTAVIAKTTKDVIDFGASIGDMATRLGTTTDFLQALQYGAEQSGVKAEGATIALQRFTRRTAEARDKAGPLRDSLERLGIAFKDQAGNAKTSEQLFDEFTKALANMEDPAMKIRTAFQFLDTEGVALTQMFQKGGKTMSDYAKEAKDLGMIMSSETIETLRNTDGELKKMSRGFKVFASQALPPVVKFLRMASIGFRSLVAQVKAVPNTFMTLATILKDEVIAKFELAQTVIKAFIAEISYQTIRFNPFADEGEIAIARDRMLKATREVAKAQKESAKSIEQRKIEAFEKDASLAEGAKKFQETHNQLQEEYNQLMGKGLKTRAKQLQVQAESGKLTEEEIKNAKKAVEARDKNALAIQRSMENLKAMLEGGEEALEQAKERQRIEDNIAKLMASGNIPRAEAEKMAISLHEATKAEQALLALLNEEKGFLAELAKEQQKDEALIAEEMAKQLELTSGVRLEMSKDLEVLKARAEGNEKLANKLQAQEDARRESLRLAQALELLESETIPMLQEKLTLQNEIDRKRNEQAQAELVNDAVRQNANRKLNEAIDRKDRARITASKAVERIDKRIAELQEKGGERAEAEIQKLQAVKERKLELILDDQTKSDLELLEREAIQIQDNHQAQMTALNQRLQDVQVEESAMRQAEQEAKRVQKAEREATMAEFNSKKADIEASLTKGQAEALAELQSVNNTHKEAILELGGALESSIQAVGDSVGNALSGITFDPPTEQTNAIIESLNKLASETTLKQISQTLQGKFVNQ